MPVVLVDRAVMNHHRRLGNPAHQEDYIHRNPTLLLPAGATSGISVRKKMSPTGPPLAITEPHNLLPAC